MLQTENAREAWNAIIKNGLEKDRVQQKDVDVGQYSSTSEFFNGTLLNVEI